MRTTAENKKRENGEDFNLHPPLCGPSRVPPSHYPRDLPPAPSLVFCRARESSYFLRRGGIEKTRGREKERKREGEKERKRAWTEHGKASVGAETKGVAVVGREGGKRLEIS